MLHITYYILVKATMQVHKFLHLCDRTFEEIELIYEICVITQSLALFIDTG